MTKVLFIGASGSGKTTLCQHLHHLEKVYQKTQALSFYDDAIDTPGEYLENRGFYSALMVTAAESDLIALVCDPLKEESFLPPNFAGAFAKPVIGIVTKCALADEKAIARAKERLAQSGAAPVFVVDTVAGQGLAPLEAALARKGALQ